MPGKPSNLEQFWQELKRRRVIHVITVYASAAFVIIELVGNLAEPLNLPSRLPTIVVIVLAIGFPLAIILSWLYDLTSEGVERTKPLNEIKDGERSTVPNAWKIATYVSFVVIIGLVVFNVMGRGNQIRPGDIQSLLILPPKNYTGDDQLDIFISGMHSALIIDIGRISEINVISKTTSDVYKDVDMTISQIAAERGVDVLLEPAVFCMGDSICIGLNMITRDEKQIWFAEYSEPKSNILNLNNRITKQIADEVKITLTLDQERLLAESRTADPDALDAYFKGLFYYEYFELAIEIDPDWAPPYAGLQRVWGALTFFGYIPQNIGHPEMYKYFQKTLELDPNSANSHFIKAQISAWHEWDWETAEREYLRSLELNPNDALCRMFYAHLLMILHRSDEAVYQAQLGLELDPLRPLVLGLYGVVMTSERDYQSAIEHCEKALSIDPDNKFAPGPLAYAYRFSGDTLKWYEIWKKGLWRTDDEYFASLDSIFHEHGYQGVIEERIRVNEEVYKNGGHISFRDQAERYCAVGKYDKAVDYLEKACERNDGMMAYTSTDVIYYPELKYNPRYIALLKKMNLPLPEE